MAISRGLGKGLSALFSDTDAEYEKSAYSSGSGIKSGEEGKEASGKPLMVPIENIYPNPGQPRKDFDASALSGLAESVRQYGIIQPITVSPRNGKYMIIAGERRYRAAKIAGLTHVPAYISGSSDKEIQEISLIENLQREDLNPVEAASAIRQLMDGYSMTQDEVAGKIGKSRPAIANLLRLLSLPSEILDFVRDKKLSEGQARCLVGMEPALAFNLARLAAENGMTVREIEKAVKSGGKKPAEKGKSAAEAGRSIELKDLISHMQKVFGTKVSAIGTDTKGRICIDYFSSDDLERIFEVIYKLK